MAEEVLFLSKDTVGIFFYSPSRRGWSTVKKNYDNFDDGGDEIFKKKKRERKEIKKNMANLKSLSRLLDDSELLPFQICEKWYFYFF